MIFLNYKSKCSYFTHVFSRNKDNIKIKKKIINNREFGSLISFGNIVLKLSY